MKKEIIGIDVSKSTLDAWAHHKRTHQTFANNEKGFNQLLEWSMEQSLSPVTGLAFCFEHTGMYSLPLSMFLHERQACFYVVSGLLVKRSLGLTRGKSDKVDARNLARFAFLHQQELHPYELPSATLIRLKQLLAFRSKLVRQSSAHKAHMREARQVLDRQDMMISLTEEFITVFAGKIRQVEKEMMSLIQSDEQLSKSFQLVSSIKGVGMVLGVAMIICTNNFKTFQTWRQFACYAGIAPFEHQSGTSFRGRTRVSSLGNRQIKTLLHQSALTAIQHNTEMKQYYQRRVEEGCNKMATINIVRNKIVSRIFAVAKRQTPYVDVHKFAA